VGLRSAMVFASWKKQKAPLLDLAVWPRNESQGSSAWTGVKARSRAALNYAD